MRDFHLQTPQREQIPSNYRSKSNSDLNKKPQKFTRKNLNHVFKAVSEEDHSAFQFPKELIESVSEVSDHNPFNESAENFLVNPVATPSSKTETVALTDLTPSPSSLLSTITYDKHIANNASKNKCVNPEVNYVKNMESIEVDIVIQHLKDARVQVMNSSDVNHSKKLLDALINVVIEDFYGGLYEEKDWLNKFVSSKVHVVSLSILFGILAFSVFLFSNSGAKGLHNGLTPT
ncbi:unnamed protein product [Fraxinus pennsylvanica]|uniref:Uncharacterized protein n=1 Tax=Fraxinus pennsylvanica TaxID=56036 RepID=A0AAD1ZL74_9LAMI|nr:unnamed protein product [Fraxinus pennsylvanica]